MTHVQLDTKTRSKLELAHSRLLHEFVDGGLLSRHLKKHITKDVYPVVIGGINVMRCAKLHAKAAAILGKLYKNDLDVKFVVAKHVADNNDSIIKHTHDMRMRFINDILTDKSLDKHLKRAAGDELIEIRLVLDDKRDVPRESVRRTMLVCLRAEYYIGGEKVYKKTFMDTGMYTTFSQDYFDKYHVFFMKVINRPIPYYMNNNIPFATCGWAYYDTVRMLVICGGAYSKALADGDVDEQKYQFVKYIKYLSKFAVLYTQVNRLKGDSDYEKMKELYESARSILNRYELVSLKDIKALSSKDKKAVQAIVGTLQQRTNLTNLEKAIRSATDEQLS